jgi:hypothetical protein
MTVPIDESTADDPIEAGLGPLERFWRNRLSRGSGTS